MKHVREAIPDVQIGRPEVSSLWPRWSTAPKRREQRYADDAELISDLEDVLAIETARRRRDRRGDERAADAALQGKAPDPVPDAPSGGGRDPAAGGCGGGGGRCLWLATLDPITATAT